MDAKPTRTQRYGPIRSAVSPAAKEKSMVIAIILGLLALFSLISFLLGTDEPRQAYVDPANEHIKLLMRFGAR